MKRTVQMIVEGHVQGVGFRYWTKIVADQLQVTGEVWNASDGSVVIIASGSADNLAAFIKRVHASPSPYGRVDRVKIDELAQAPASQEFKIK